MMRQSDSEFMRLYDNYKKSKATKEKKLSTLDRIFQAVIDAENGGTVECEVEYNGQVFKLSCHPAKNGHAGKTAFYLSKVNV